MPPNASADSTSARPDRPARAVRRTVGRGARALVWILLVVMLVSLIVQSSAVAAASSGEEPMVERLHPTDASSPVPTIGFELSGPESAFEAAEPDVPALPATPIVESFDGTIEPTLPPLTTTSSRIEDADFLQRGDRDDARSAHVPEGDAGLLQNDARERIYEEVTRSPGLSMSEAAERTGIPLSTVRYHTWVLAKEDVVDEAKIRGKRRLFPTAMDGERKELNAALADEATARMLDSVRSHEPASVSELAESLDRSASTVSYHLQRLQNAGLVERERDGDATVTRLHPFVRAELSGALQADGGPADGATAADVAPADEE